MPLERSRQLIGGVWKYVTANQTDNGGNGGSQPIETLVDVVNFDDFVLDPTPDVSWPGRAPWRTIDVGTVVLRCDIIILEPFDDSGAPGEIQVTNDPTGDGTQLSGAPDPTTLGQALGAASWQQDGIGDPGTFLPWTPTSAPMTPIVGMQAWVGDGSTGRAAIITQLYPPSS